MGQLEHGIYNKPDRALTPCSDDTSSDTSSIYDFRNTEVVDQENEEWHGIVDESEVSPLSRIMHRSRQSRVRRRDASKPQYVVK